MAWNSFHWPHPAAALGLALALRRYNQTPLSMTLERVCRVQWLYVMLRRRRRRREPWDDPDTHTAAARLQTLVLVLALVLVLVLALALVQLLAKSARVVVRTTKEGGADAHGESDGRLADFSPRQPWCFSDRAWLGPGRLRGGVAFDESWSPPLQDKTRRRRGKKEGHCVVRIGTG